MKLVRAKSVRAAVVAAGVTGVAVVVVAGAVAAVVVVVAVAIAIGANPIASQLAGC
jgi:hypothetical protein